ncbi:ribonuclease BN [Halosimplex marinum]|uniref:ribonuclease BN n=1 Tax=Halosimplex marinum TaxID=3396620 RepID=UPI003F542A75
MTADTGADDDSAAGDERTASAGSTTSPSPGSEEAGVDAEVAELREELESLRTRVDEKTVHRDDIREELRRYVRKRQRRGHATGWGPYLVLLYGTAMTVGAFYYLNNWAAVAAMLVVWLSTLGLYVFMVVLGSFLAAGRKAAGLTDLLGKFR